MRTQYNHTVYTVRNQATCFQTKINPLLPSYGNFERLCTTHLLSVKKTTFYDKSIFKK